MAKLQRVLSSFLWDGSCLFCPASTENICARHCGTTPRRKKWHRTLERSAKRGAACATPHFGTSTITDVGGAFALETAKRSKCAAGAKLSNTAAAAVRKKIGAQNTATCAAWNFKPRCQTATVCCDCEFDFVIIRMILFFFSPVFPLCTSVANSHENSYRHHCPHSSLSIRQTEKHNTIRCQVPGRGSPKK